MNSLVFLVVLVLAIILLGVSAWRLALFNTINKFLFNTPKTVIKLLEEYIDLIKKLDGKTSKELKKLVDKLDSKCNLIYFDEILKGDVDFFLDEEQVYKSYNCLKKKINNGLALWGTLVGVSSIVLLFCVIKLAVNFKNQKKLKK